MTLALVIGLVVVNILKTDAGMNIDVNTINGSAITGYTQAATLWVFHMIGLVLL